MSRTFRNRHTVPHGYEVRDGGRVCRRSLAEAHHEPRPFRRWLLRCESAPARREHAAWYRRVCNGLLRVGREEEIPPFRGTSGWMTW